MNISQLAISLSAEDIKTMINDFVKIEGLKLENIEYEENCLKINGVFKKIISLGFSASVGVIGVNNNILTLSFKKASFMKIGILKTFRKIALKIALKGFKEKGIEIEDDKIKVDMKKVLNDIKFIDLNLMEAKIVNGKLDVVAENISLSLPKMAKKPTIKVDEKIEVSEEAKKDEKIDNNETLSGKESLDSKDKEENINKAFTNEKSEEEFEEEDYTYNINIEKTEDVYTHSREAIIRSIPSKAKTYSDFIMFVPDLVALVCRLMKDKRVPKKTRIALGLSFGYTVLPFDIIPDKIPLLGQIDELAVILFALDRIVSDVDTEVLLENWQGKNELVMVLTQAVEYISGFTGAKNLNKIYDVIDTLT